MSDDDNNAISKKRKFKPASKEAKPKICVAQFVKGIKKELTVLNYNDFKLPPEIEAMSIKVEIGGYPQQKEKTM
jgi:hypothetical protein